MKQHYLLSILCMLLFFTHYSWGQVKIGDNPTQVNPLIYCYKSSISIRHSSGNPIAKGVNVFLEIKN